MENLISPLLSLADGAVSFVAYPNSKHSAQFLYLKRSRKASGKYAKERVLKFSSLKIIKYVLFLRTRFFMY